MLRILSISPRIEWTDSVKMSFVCLEENINEEHTRYVLCFSSSMKVKRLSSHVKLSHLVFLRDSYNGQNFKCFVYVCITVYTILELQNASLFVW